MAIVAAVAVDHRDVGRGLRFVVETDRALGRLRTGDAATTAYSRATSTRASL